MSNELNEFSSIVLNKLHVYVYKYIVEILSSPLHCYSAWSPFSSRKKCRGVLRRVNFDELKSLRQFRLGKFVESQFCRDDFIVTQDRTLFWLAKIISNI